MGSHAWTRALFPLLLLASACTGDGASDETTLTTADFESERSAPADGLTDVDWVIGLVEIDGEPVEPPPDNRMSFTLATGGEMDGNAGCNGFTGSWETTGDAIVITIDDSGQDECAQVDDWEAAVDLLLAVDTWRIDDLTLVLTNADAGRMIAVAS